MPNSTMYRSKSVLAAVGVVAVVAIVLGFSVATRSDVALAATTDVQPPFPDFGFLPPPTQYSGPVFRLSQDYPLHEPKEPMPQFMKTDFRKDWHTYMLQVRAYCLEGNIETDWRVETNPVRRWYHVPWQHYGPSGREGVRGLTKEAPVAVRQLAAAQSDSTAVTWAVGFYNPRAGYTIGRVWRDHLNPDLTATTAPTGGFPEGSVECKPLFVSVHPTSHPERQVPSLVNPVQWTAYITPSYQSSDRMIDTVTLIQMDIAVRDSRAPLGWIFGTFQYNGVQNKTNRWENLVPLGLQWGLDPTNNVDQSNPTPTHTIINAAIKESIINPDASELPPTHLGWNGRLNGPVDNPRSSCMSCHATGQITAKSAITPFFSDHGDTITVGGPTWMRWFRNIQCATTFDPGTKSTDYNLQLAQGIQNFMSWRQTQDGLFASRYAAPGRSTGRMMVMQAGDRRLLIQGARDLAPSGGHPIVRDMPAKPVATPRFNP